MKLNPAQTVQNAALLLVLAGLVVVGWRMGQTTAKAKWYRAELAALTEHHQQLRNDHMALAKQYNQAITHTAVTEVVVKDGQLSIALMGLTGELDRVDLPFNAREEIFFDFVVVDGRLMPRRVFELNKQPVQLDEKLAHINWHDAATKGLAVYRAFPMDGRWKVSISGNGALGLSPVSPGERLELHPAPQLDAFAPADYEADGKPSKLEVLRNLF